MAEQRNSVMKTETNLYIIYYLTDHPSARLTKQKVSDRQGAWRNVQHHHLVVSLAQNHQSLSEKRVKGFS